MIEGKSALGDENPGKGRGKGKGEVPRGGYADEMHERLKERKQRMAGGFNERGAAIGETGYINRSSGWVDNGRAMANVMADVVVAARARNQQGDQRRVTFVRGKASHLLFSTRFPSKIIGAAVAGGQDIHATLTILATGAHTPSLLDLRGRAEARAQCMAYFPVTAAEARQLRDMPVLLNIGTGMFAIPPILTPLLPFTPGGQPEKAWMIKIARHAYGYANPTEMTIATGPDSGARATIKTSVPAQHFSPIPAEAEQACRSFLRAILPQFSDRPFVSTRLCWYTDTPVGDFLVDYHPEYEGVFLATGGSGHAFKFLPVLGDKVVRAVEGRLEDDLMVLWKWPRKVTLPFNGTEDGSRSGSRTAVLGRGWAKEKSRL